MSNHWAEINHVSLLRLSSPPLKSTGTLELIVYNDHNVISDYCFGADNFVTIIGIHAANVL